MVITDLCTWFNNPATTSNVVVVVFFSQFILRRIRKHHEVMKSIFVSLTHTVSISHCLQSSTIKFTIFGLQVSNVYVSLVYTSEWCTESEMLKNEMNNNEHIKLKWKSEDALYLVLLCSKRKSMLSKY